MPELVLPNLDESVLENLRERARRHGRSPADEARAILAEALKNGGAGSWESVDAIHRRLAESGRDFGDSAALLREDRDR